MPTINCYSMNAETGCPLETALKNSAVIRENNISITLFSDLAAIPVRRTVYGNSGWDTLILEVQHIFELDSLILIKECFEHIPLILILPGDDREFVSLGYQLYPRYLAYSDDNGYINKVCGVIEKLYTANSANDSATFLTPPVKVHTQPQHNGGIS